MKSIDQQLELAGVGTLKKVLSGLLKAYTTPAFGAVKTTEVDVAFLKALMDLGVLSERPDLFEMVSTLRVTRSRARNLLYNLELRQFDQAELDERVRDTVLRPVLVADGKRISLEVESPVVLDCLRAKVKVLGHLTDQSFSPTVVVLTKPAFADLVESVIPKEQGEAALKALRKAGADGPTVGKALAGVLGRIGSRLGGEALEETGLLLGESLRGFLDGNFDKLQDLFNKLSKPATVSG